MADLSANACVRKLADLVRHNENLGVLPTSYANNETEWNHNHAVTCSVHRVVADMWVGKLVGNVHW